MIPTGTHLGRYEIRSQLGAGGMGEVYRARDEKLNRDVAIKVLPASPSQDKDRLRRFEQEAQAAGALNHPNILAVYDVGTHDGSQPDDYPDYALIDASMPYYEYSPPSPGGNAQNVPPGTPPGRQLGFCLLYATLLRTTSPSSNWSPR